MSALIKKWMDLGRERERKRERERETTEPLGVRSSRLTGRRRFTRQRERKRKKRRKKNRGRGGTLKIRVLQACLICALDASGGTPRTSYRVIYDMRRGQASGLGLYGVCVCE